eukprot:gnl/Dysnectes_brevis/352_a389_5910.p1 GENE.gnl/Dysnectes_brevis/352_a389_5910~~gnl/Dysnectes_brevis/352_a389_5910.p1  ORF type:complete len:313 (-),score=117.23 gnl/Dysnectes_brevis/352_a389_5910:101-1039(-)
MTSLVKIHFLDDGAKTISIDKESTTSDLVEIIADKIDLTQAVADFKIFQVCFPGGQRTETCLDVEQKPYAVQEAWPKSSKYPAPFLVFKRLFFSDSASEDLSTDPVLKHLMFAQARDTVLNGVIALDWVLACELASISVQQSYGPFNAEVHKPDFLAAHLKQYVPSRMLEEHSVHEWEEKIFECHASLPAGLSPEECEDRYLAKVRALPIYGCTLIRVKYNTRGSSRVGKPIYIGVSCEGVHFFGMDLSREGFYSFNSILSWGNSINSFAMKTDEVDDGLSHIFSTTQGKQISDLIQGYVTRILAKLSSNAQ